MIAFYGCSQQHREKEELMLEQTPVEILKDSAEKRLYQLIDEKYPHGVDIKPEISDMEVVLNDDSLYWAEFKMKYQNAFGGFSRGEFDYIYVLESDGSPKSGMRDFSHKYNKKFSMVLCNIEHIAVTKRGIPDSLVYGNNQFMYNVARSYCFLSELDDKD